MGMALTSCTVPHAGKPTFDLPEDEMEIGIGIHGEPGRVRMKLKSADEITEMLMEPIVNDLPREALGRTLEATRRAAGRASAGAGPGL